MTREDQFDLVNENTINIEKDKENTKDRKRFVFFVLIFLVLLFFSTFGITVSFYRGGSSESQEIETDPTPEPTEEPSVNPEPGTRPATDQIIFTYSDVDQGGNGIDIVNAMPMSDSKGKVLTGKGEYFDFSITATSKNSDLLYKILIKKDSASTLANSDLRIYLTSVSGSYESEVILTTFSALEEEKINGINYYVLYTKRLGKGINNYSDFYRLRMWVREDATDYNDKTFMLKVDVVAEQVGD